MDLPVLALVLVAAAAHAGWNAWLKDRSADLASFAVLAIGWLVAGISGAVVVGFPSWASWPYLLATTVVHTLYAVLLIKAYRHADFSLAYPIARGSGPLFVSLTAPYLLNEHLEGPSQFAVTLLVIGIFMIGLFRDRSSIGGRRAVMLSLGTGVLIAAYTMIDGEGARSGSGPHVYAAWLFILTGGALIALAMQQRKLVFSSLQFRPAVTGILAGLLSVISYWIILWAMTVAPTALVAATRETSILFAALLGWGFLGEKIRPLRWVGIVITLIGLILAKL